MGYGMGSKGAWCIVLSGQSAHSHHALLCEALYVELRKLKEPLSDKQFKDLYVKWQSS